MSHYKQLTPELKCRIKAIRERTDDLHHLMITIENGQVSQSCSELETIALAMEWAWELHINCTNVFRNVEKDARVRANACINLGGLRAPLINGYAKQE